MEPQDPDWQARVRDSFGRQKIMALLGAGLARLEPGLVEIELPYREDLTQQHGFIHAGAVGTVADSAGGYAGFSLMPPGSSVLTTEYKLHFLAPADGERVLARGRVVRAGRTLTVCELSADVEKGGRTTRCAFGTQTVMTLRDRADR